MQGDLRAPNPAMQKEVLLFQHIEMLEPATYPYRFSFCSASKAHFSQELQKLFPLITRNVSV